MALIRCPECGKEISSNAKACPNCGNPVPKKMVPVHIERSRTFAMAVNCYVYLDGNMIGELKPGGILQTELCIGTHYIATESDVRSFGYSAADTRSQSGQQFKIDEQDRRISIAIATKGSWTGGVGKCVVGNIAKN